MNFQPHGFLNFLWRKHEVKLLGGGPPVLGHPAPTEAPQGQTRQKPQMSAGDCLNRTHSYNLEVCMLQKAKNLLIVVLVAIAVVIEIPLAIQSIERLI